MRSFIIIRNIAFNVQMADANTAVHDTGCPEQFGCRWRALQGVIGVRLCIQ